MSIDMNDRVAIERRLWEEIERHQVGMLGVVGRLAHHTQPMTAFVERETEEIWFFTRSDSDLAQHVGAGHKAMFVFQQRDVQACICGQLTVQHDQARIDKYWNAVVAAWYPQGKSDPKLTLLKMACEDADVWISRGGPVKFVWEIALANATRHEPHLGGRANLHFH
ncbi:pyridoxamine 5'-phosphate oxidase family protein [Phenylobacterium sp.]|uniref:pyridoxamine 5'-phosphate oxidase family protein n=1 Tax=Phenylobacterium sp. TaxID=1871053 RepID=UPI002FC8F9BA